MFEMPIYRHPDFNSDLLKNAPDAKFIIVDKDGVVPENFHSTSMFPEYCKINKKWHLAEESRMDSSIVLNNDDSLSVVENRNVKIVFKFMVFSKYCSYFNQS
jgi:hypothetical protein